ncbi:hypothetical protein I302_109116 [Kwoniella bestiolae CBS 10118]|uniref:Uncharacterized protein n=1 Tax=Kwoniella bestiolae CBS 10118 TaxID=1296100 RepID=A0A1B9FV12_9TREE|nr:hypothetical protein I302_08261 [Kwoniella bestiolae CBS 10118]OCF22610.1 hypothetical protein I302_08261 [Kwoniella bestiolae CBS 10118]
MDPLLLAHPPTSYAQISGVTTDEMPFDSFCIVCDRLIIPPKEVEPVEGPKPTKKKLGGGTIRVKNPDGTTTTRSANGQKVTRPGLKRNPNSAARLAALNSSSKMQPLTRSKTNESVTSPTSESPIDLSSPQSQKVITPRINTSSPPFRSSIYCSKQCMEHDAGKSSEAYANIARTLSYDFSHAFPLDTPGVAVPDHARSPYGPPSPLFVSGSDTESSAASNAGGLHDNSGPASSAPKFMEYFRLSKEGPDDAWNSIQRQRRSSMQPSSSQRPTSSHSHVHPSNESLSSLWNADSDLALDHRSVSGSGSHRMRAMTPAQIPEEDRRESHGAGRRSVSISSEHSAPIPARAPLRRSDLSHTSLLASSPSSMQNVPIPPEFGSAPSHTLDLLQSYAHAFPVRSPSGLSTSVQRGFVFPGSTAMSPNPSESRRSSMSRPVSGTIRAKSRNGNGNGCEATWDSFGKEVVDEKNYKSYCKKTGQSTLSSSVTAAPAPMSVPADFRGRPELDMNNSTPKQSLERGIGGWKIKYFQPSSNLVERSGTITRDRSSSRSTDRTSSSSGRSASRPRTGNGINIPTTSNTLSTSISSNSTSRTPRMLPPPRPATTLPTTGEAPDMSSLKLDTTSGFEGVSNSVPKSGFNWESSEKKGMKTYEIPDLPKFKLDRTKAGLFYFQ